jgi:hypothetical protein
MSVARREELDLQLKGLVYVRALLETHGASTAEVDAHSNAIDRVRTELARLDQVGAQGGYR